MRPATNAPMGKLLRLLDRLERAKIAYRLEHVRESVLVSIAVPGERWEVEFFPDGSIEIERFWSRGTVEVDESLLDTLISEHGGS